MRVTALPSQGPSLLLRWIDRSVRRRCRLARWASLRSYAPKKSRCVRGGDATPREWVQLRRDGQVLDRFFETAAFLDEFIPEPVTSEKALGVFGDHLPERIKIHVGSPRECSGHDTTVTKERARPLRCDKWLWPGYRSEVSACDRETGTARLDECRTPTETVRIELPRGCSLLATIESRILNDLIEKGRQAGLRDLSFQLLDDFWARAE